jgi:isopenicillin-N epimerase
MDPRSRAAPLEAFALDPAIVHLNHGSYGACPRVVLDAQRAWRDRMEAATMRFFVLDRQDALDVARAHLADFLGAEEAGLVFVPNATTGVATALWGLVDDGAEIVTTDHAYAACRNALERVAAARRARIVTAHVEFPVRDPGQAVASLLAAVTPATRVVLLDHVTSPTALVLDAAAVVAALAPRGIDVVVDGAHAPGMLPLEIGALDGVAAYAGNLHKWVCAPKGAGFLWVREDRRARVRPLVTSHGASLPEDHPDKFFMEHDWTGTHDPSAFLSVPTAIDEIARLGAGWPATRARNHRLALLMRDRLGEILEAAPAAPDTMLGTMVAIPIRLPAGTLPRPFERRLLEHGWEAAIIEWSRLGGTYVRVAAHLYNTLDDAARLGEHLRGLGVRGIS